MIYLIMSGFLSSRDMGWQWSVSDYFVIERFQFDWKLICVVIPKQNSNVGNLLSTVLMVQQSIRVLGISLGHHHEGHRCREILNSGNPSNNRFKSRPRTMLTSCLAHKYSQHKIYLATFDICGFISIPQVMLWLVLVFKLLFWYGRVCCGLIHHELSISKWRLALLLNLDCKIGPRP